MSRKIITLNIEGNRHLDLVKQFLQREQPDIICLQEVFEIHVQELAEATGFIPFYTPMSNVTFQSIHADPFGYWGLLQLVHPKFSIQEQKAEYYVGNATDIPIFFENENPNSINRAVLWSKFSFEESELKIATTHFTWSPKGEVTKEQLHDFMNMGKILDTVQPDILCGDFNAPRGGEIFNTLSEKYKDNIPQSVTTTIDGSMHKSGNDIQLVVDGMFSTAEIEVDDVRVENGISDHYAVVAELRFDSLLL